LKQWTYNKNRTDILNNLRQKINQDILNHKKVECIGYYLPDIDCSSVINETSLMMIRENKVEFFSMVLRSQEKLTSMMLFS